MSGVWALDWAVMALSLFNTVLLLWLGLTVLLNAERRRWGTWLAGGGLLCGGAFFVSHSAILGHDLHESGLGLELWWRVGWLPVVALPFAWYLVTLWYAGFWEPRPGVLKRRHRPWFALATTLAGGLTTLLLVGHPIPSYGQIVQLDLSASPAVAGVPILLAVYPAYTLFCISMSLDVLRHPSPSSRLMGDLARRRARPWLVGASLVLLLVSLLVAGVIVWVGVRVRGALPGRSYVDLGRTIAAFDGLISALIAAATLLVGQALVSYEVFTGQALPRRGFRRHWRNAVLLAGGYGAIVAWSLVSRQRAVYSLLATAVLMVALLSLSSWRSFAERERTIAGLRPFVSSERLYDHLLAARPDGAENPARSPFQTLCRDLLGARMATLIPLNPLAGAPLSYRAGAPDGVPGPPAIAALAAQVHSPQTLCLPLDPARYGGAIWAVPLWNAGQQSGMLLLGDKRDGGLYTQEEIEIARASGERLIDVQATAAMAQRLASLLRQRLAEVKVMGDQGRRVLHDQVLPQLHAALLYLNSAPPSPVLRQASEALSAAHREIAALMRDSAPAVPPELERDGLARALRTAVEQEHGEAFDRVEWDIDPQAEGLAAQLADFAREVLFWAGRELIRNAARHARGGERDHALCLTVGLHTAEGLRLVVQDDGVGPGTAFSSEESGGLALHSALLAAIGARLALAPRPSGGTVATLSLPQAACDALASESLSLASTRVEQAI